MTAIRRLALVITCLAVVQCGGSTPTGPTTEVPLQPLPPGPPAPAPVPLPSSVPQVFVGAGDIAVCDANAEATARLLDTIGGTVFTLGDAAYFQGTTQQFRDCYDPTWGRHKSRTRPVPGNHEYESPGAAPYFAYFGANAGPPGLGYYSFDLGDWHAIALNSNVAVDAGSSQGAWLRSDLATSRARCTVAYWHHPLFTSGPNGPSPRMRDFWRMLYAAGVELVLNGHDHLYERFAEQDPDGRPDPARGIREIIAGTGGAPGYQTITVSANSDMRITNGFGVLKLTLRADGYEWQFVPISGRADTGTAACH